MSIEEIISHPVVHLLVSGVVFFAQLYISTKFNAISKEQSRAERRDEKFEGELKEMREDISDVKREFYGLKTVHDRIMQEGGHRKK